MAVAWYYSDALAGIGLRITDDEVNYDLTASQAGEGLVRLEGESDDDRLNRPGNWGLAWTGGLGKIGAVVAEGDGFVTRRMTIVEGDLREAAPAELSQDVPPKDPFLAFGIKYREVNTLLHSGPWTRGNWMAGMIRGSFLCMASAQSQGTASH